MAHAQDEANENHWPGYVDALTTMLMVMTFVMMILGIAVFAMSQNVSRIIVEAIARAALIEPKGEAEPVPELTERILDKLRRHPPRPPLDAAERLNPETRGGGKADPDPAPVPAQDPAAPAMMGDEKRLVSAQPAFVPPAPGPVRSQTAGQALVLEFQPRATRLDDTVSTSLNATLANDGAFQGARSIEIRATIDRASPSLSDARRIAYYRAMLVRSAAMAAGIPATRIRVLTDEVSAAPDGSSVDLVRVIPLIEAP